MTLRPVQKPADGPQPPAYLSSPMRAWWTSVVTDYDLDEHHEHLLTAAAESWDRAQEARRIVEAEGLVTIDRFGQSKAHPAVAIERDALAAFARLLRELDLDAEPPATLAAKRGSRYR